MFGGKALSVGSRKLEVVACSCSCLKVVAAKKKVRLVERRVHSAGSAEVLKLPEDVRVGYWCQTSWISPATEYVTIPMRLERKLQVPVYQTRGSTFSKNLKKDLLISHLEHAQC